MVKEPMVPMMAVPSATLPIGADWTYEVKWDGYRALAVKRGGRVTLRSRTLKDFTASYPAVVAAVSSIAADDVILDGEIVALDGDGRPSFQALQHRTTAHALVYYAFDLLRHDGRDLTREPLSARRAELTSVVTGSHVLLSTALPGKPNDIVEAVKELGLEGIVAKRRESLYLPGRRSDAWIKVRFHRRQEFAIGGFKADGRSFDSILVGYYDDDGKFRYAGKVRAGFTPALRRTVHARIAPLRVSRCPFVNLPSSGGGHWGEGVTAEEMTTLTWVKPKVVAEVTFTEWTRDGSLRHSAFVALRDDKPAADVRRET
jgi:bifunctional non-homologous end joining protein LigD